MKIVVWVVFLIFAGTACLVCARCYEDLCNEKRCQICEEIKRHCNTESTSTKCDGFCKDLEAIDYNTQNRDNFMELWMTDKTRMWKVQSDLAKTRRNLETVSQSLHDAKETIRNLINENNYLRNIISDPKEMLFLDDNAPHQNGRCDCIVQEDSLSRCLTQLEEQSSQSDRFIGYLKEMAALERERMQNETIREIINNYMTVSQGDKTTIEMLQHDVTTTNQSLQDAKRSLQLLQAENNDLRNNDCSKEQHNQKIATAVLSVILGVMCIVIVLCMTIYRCQFHKGGHAAPEKMSLVSDTDTKTSMNIEEGVKADVSLRDQERQDNVSDDSAVFAGSSAESVNMQGGLTLEPRTTRARDPSLQIHPTTDVTALIKTLVG